MDFISIHDFSVQPRHFDARAPIVMTGDFSSDMKSNDGGDDVLHGEHRLIAMFVPKTLVLQPG